MKIAIFGGAFDPPHHGHMNLVRAVRESVRPDRFLIIPTGNAPHKKTETGYISRFLLAQAAFVNCGNCEISDIESGSEKSYTIDTLYKLREKYPCDELILAMGSDSYNTLEQWKGYYEILRMCRVFPVSREIVRISSKEIRGKFKPKRYTHSINVAIKCGELARHYRLSPESAERAYLAGILHDIEKRDASPPAEYNPLPVESAEPKLWHAIAGAVYVRDVLGIADPEILSAVRFHTIARENVTDMSMIEKIVFIADKISAERDYDGVERFRALSKVDLDASVREFRKIIGGKQK